jgi:uncharacterized membrane protein YhaH (DUF805 family)
MDWTWYLFRFHGRINRALLWQALLIVAVLAAVLGVIGQVVGVIGTPGKLKFSLDLDFDFGLDRLASAIDPGTYRFQTPRDRAIQVLNGVSAVLFFWIFLATAIKRLHDRDRSGWWIVPFFIVPRSLFYLWDWLPDARWFVPIEWAIYALWLWGIVELYVVPGTAGSNRFGPDPLAQDGTNRPGTSASSAKAWDQHSELEIVPPSASPPGGMHVKRDA